MERGGKTAEDTAEEVEEAAETAWRGKAEPGNRDCLDRCLTTADNRQVSSLLCFCFPICEMKRINKHGTLSSGKVYRVQKVFWAPYIETLLCVQGAVTYF